MTKDEYEKMLQDLFYNNSWKPKESIIFTSEKNLKLYKEILKDASFKVKEED